MRTGGQILVDALLKQGSKFIFGVPGESYLAVLDALYDKPDLPFVVCRQEGGAAMMADAYGKMTGQPGICFVTRGPGATNASAGVHIAQQDSTPMILFIGQVSRDQIDREAFQEIDFRRMFGQLAKWVAQIDDTARIPEYVSRAYHTATSGRPGPVVIALPEDMLRISADVLDVPSYTPIEASPSEADMDQFAEILSGVERPLVIVGGSGWNAEVCYNLQKFAENWNIPVTGSFRAQDRLDNFHPNYVGDVGIGINPKLAKRIKSSDLIISIGARLGEMTTSNYTLIRPPIPEQKLIHIYPSGEELGRVYLPCLGIHSSVNNFLSMASKLKPCPRNWKTWTSGARADYENWSEHPTFVPGNINMGEIVVWLRENLPNDSVICNGAGNFSAWIHRFYRYRPYRSQLAPTSGSMGYGTPAAIAAKMIFPHRVVVAITGDGDFMMHGQELATAMQYGTNIIIILVNNGMYGTIRMHQEREYPSRVLGTKLQNPNFTKLALAYGAHGECINNTTEFPSAFRRAQDSGKPAMIEIKVSPEAITPNASINDIRTNSSIR